MADFPALEILTPGAHQLRPGTRLPLPTLPFRIGRQKQNNLAVPTAEVSPRHCEVVNEYGRWWVRDLGTTNGTFHLGERIHDAELRDGDVFELPSSVCFRLLLQEPVDPRDAQMERALIESPDDPRRWSVYADWLQEHGAPLGERLANPREADNRRWLGPLAGYAGRGVVQVTWAHGVPTRAVLRSLAPTGAPESWENPLTLLLSEPIFRFLRALELDLCSFHRANMELAWAERVLAMLGAKPLPMMENLLLGPCTPPHDADRRAHLFRPWRAAALNAQPLDPAAIFHSGTDPGFDIFWEAGRWRLRADAELKVNGVMRKTALLRPGDLIEPHPGAQLRFDA